MQSFHVLSDIINGDIIISMETERLIERCKQGDANALGELYKAYASKMRGVCLRYVDDHQAVDDVLHDAFLIIFTSFDRLRDTSKAESWMMTITRNVALKYNEHLRSQQTVTLDAADAIADVESEQSVKGIPIEDVMQMVDRLPEGYAKVFRLSVFEGMTHKEIATTLGIEPHSSSSQLARAKKMLRRMMQQYWAAVLLLLIPIPFLLYKKKETIPTKKEEPTTPVTAHVPEPHITNVTIDTVESIMAHKADITMPDMPVHIPTVQEQTAADTTHADTTHTDTIRIPHRIDLPHFDIADNAVRRSGGKDEDNNTWSVELAFAGNVTNQSTIRPFGITEVSKLSATDGEWQPMPVTFKTWSDYASFLSEQPDEDDSPMRDVIKNIALNNANQPDGDEIVRKSHHQMPFMWTLAITHQQNSRFAIESGLSYSRLSSDFEMGTNGNEIHEQQTIHYIGLPLRGIYNVYSRNAWSLYGSLGLTVDLPVHSSLRQGYYLNGNLTLEEKTTIHAPWQLSVGTGLGLQYHLTPNISLFAELRMQYYIPTGSKIETYYTDHPFTFQMPVGIRFTW